MATKEKTMNIWQGQFGNNYTKRNFCNTVELDSLFRKLFGISRSILNKQFLGGIDPDGRVLEVGCNYGIQLDMLKQLGFKNLYGIDVNLSAIELSGKDIKAIFGDANDIPFKDDFFDLVMTNGLLIHIPPDNINRVLDEIHRCSKKFILCYEYFNDRCAEIIYHGHMGLLWKNDFASLFLKRFNDLKLVKDKQLLYMDGSGNTDTMFLLHKKEDDDK